MKNKTKKNNSLLSRGLPDKIIIQSYLNLYTKFSRLFLYHTKNFNVCECVAPIWNDHTNGGGGGGTACGRTEMCSSYKTEEF